MISRPSVEVVFTVRLDNLFQSRIFLGKKSIYEYLDVC